MGDGFLSVVYSKQLGFFGASRGEGRELTKLADIQIECGKGNSPDSRRSHGVVHGIPRPIAIIAYPPRQRSGRNPRTNLIFSLLDQAIRPDFVWRLLAPSLVVEIEIGLQRSNSRQRGSARVGAI